MAVNLTWHSFLEQVWGIRLRCRTNCTCCETSELQLFRTRFHLVREPAAAKHKRHFAPNAKRLWQLGQRSDKCRLNMRTRMKTQKQVLLARPLFFAHGETKELDSLTEQHLLTLRHLLCQDFVRVQGLLAVCAHERVQRSWSSLKASY